jgi:hypothetical protein
VAFNALSVPHVAKGISENIACAAWINLAVIKNSYGWFLFWHHFWVIQR